MSFYQIIAAAVAVNTVSTLVLIFRARRDHTFDRMANTAIALTWAAICISMIVEATR